MQKITYKGEKGWFLTDQQKKELEQTLFYPNSSNEEVVQ